MYIDCNYCIKISAYVYYKLNIVDMKLKLNVLILIIKIIDFKNEEYLNKKASEENAKGISFDFMQKKAIYCDELKTMVVAGAGSGKTSVIIGKIVYLIEERKLNPREILCLSFTNNACDNIRQRLKYNVDVYTFHKLSLKILNDNYYINKNYLKYIINEFFLSEVSRNKYYVKKLTHYIKKFNYRKYNVYLNLGLFDRLKSDIEKFIEMFIVYGYQYKDFLKFKKYKYIYALIFNIYNLYMHEMSSSKEVDLNTLISIAHDELRKDSLKYKYIIIDEFQDISSLRYKLIKKIIQFNNCKLFTVGDDYQSIYAFSGSNLNEYYNLCVPSYDTKVIKLKYNYRSCQELVNISNYFITKNLNQIKKNIYCKFNILYPLKLIRKKYDILFSLLEKIKIQYKSILILGRYNSDINKYIKNDTLVDLKRKTDCIIEYKTVHASKGLEADCVIVINLTNGKYGFPSNIDNSKFMDYAFPKEKYLYAEERRLFYVALTRSRRDVYLIIEKNMSIFAREVIKYGRYIKV